MMQNLRNLNLISNARAINSFRDWRDLMQERFPGFDPRPYEDGAFSATLSHHTVGEIDLTEMFADRCSIINERLHEKIAAHPGCCLILQLSGDARISQANGEVFLRPGDLTLVDGTRPARFDFSTPYRNMAIRIPHGALSERLNGRIPTSKRLAYESVISEIIRGMIISVARGANSLHPEQGRKLMSTLIDLLGTALLDLSDESTNHSFANIRGCSTKLLTIRHYVERHLHDPDLKPQIIARANAVSVRQLYRLFEDMGESPSDWLLSQRLERSREALRDPSYASESVANIALRFGFSSFSHFSRSYKKRFGRTPRDERLEANTQRVRRH